MAATHSVRSNTYDIGDNSGSYYWQKQIEIDNAGKIYALVIDKPTTDWYMYLYGYTDTTGVYAIDNNFTTRISNVAGKLASASMIFDAARRYLHIAFTTVETSTFSLYHGIYDPVNGEWVEQNIIHSGEEDLYQHSDICLDQQGKPYIVYNTGGGTYQNYHIVTKMGNNWIDVPLPDIDPSQYVACIACSVNNEIYLYVSLATTGLGSLYIFPAGAPNFNNQIDITLRDAVMVLDNIGDAHFIGLDASSNLDYWKYDYSAGTAAEVTAVVAAAAFDGSSKFGLSARWDYANNRPDVYLYYVDATDPNGVVSYKKYTTSLGSETTIDDTVTDACIQAHLCKLPAYADDGLLLVKWCDDDGTTPFPVEMYHSGDIQEPAPSVGGYYGLGNIRNSIIYGIGVDSGDWKVINQYPAQIIAACKGAMTEDVVAQVFDGESNEVIMFCTGRDIKEYRTAKFDDDGQPITCIIQRPNIDFGDPDRWKTIDIISVDFEAPNGLTVLITNNQGGSWYKELTQDDSGKRLRVGFPGRRFAVTITESSRRDFKLYRAILYASTTEQVL